MLSNKTKLCVKVLVAMASAPPSRPVTVQALSDRLHVSVSHLESITRILRLAGFVRAARGPGGGYFLACDADTLTIWTVVERVDGALREPPPPSAKAAPIASLEAAIRATFIQALSEHTVGEYAQPGTWEPSTSGSAAPGFRLRPMPAIIRPLAPNSVFELSSFARARAA